MELKEAKYLGGIGAVLNLVSYAVGGILAIAGYVLILLALNKISKIFNDDEVFKKYLYGVVLWIIAVLIVIFAVGISFCISFIYPTRLWTNGNVIFFSWCYFVLYPFSYWRLLYKEKL